MTSPISRSSIFTLAWTLYRAGLFDNFGDALKCAWAQSKNVASMKEGETNFTFRKKNGEQREARGTLDHSMFDYEYKTTQKNRNPLTQCYYDLDRNAWRSYSISSLVAA